MYQEIDKKVKEYLQQFIDPRDRPRRQDLVLYISMEKYRKIIQEWTSFFNMPFPPLAEDGYIGQVGGLQVYVVKDMIVGRK